jgi:hypothetical protein
LRARRLLSYKIILKRPVRDISETVLSKCEFHTEKIWFSVLIKDALTLA